MRLPQWWRPPPLFAEFILLILVTSGAPRTNADTDDGVDDEVVKLLSSINDDRTSALPTAESIEERLYPNAKKGVAYLNIPYALPPTGHFRHTRPRPIGDGAPLDPNTTHFTAFCPQSTTPASERWISAGANMTEDCLFLNVYAPADTGPHPVYVHLHGGFLSHGSTADYGCLGVLENLVVRHRIVVVTVQYRLGPYGFLNFRDDERPKRTLIHNLGLKDQRAALEWIRANIHHYGGDPTRVTLGGDGAGACSAAYHAFAADEEPLFRGVILMSASLEVCRDVPDPKHSVSQKFLLDACPEAYSTPDDLNATVSKASRLAECLNSLSMEEMVRKEVGVGMWQISVLADNGDTSANLTVNAAAKTPLNVLMGVARDAWLNYDDELLRQSAVLRDDWAKHPEHYLGTVFHYLYPELDNVDDLINKTVELYKDVFGMAQPSTPAEWKKLYVKIMTDTMLTSSILSDADRLQRMGHSVALYKFTHEGPFYQRAEEIGPGKPQSAPDSSSITMKIEHSVVPDSAETAYLFMPEWLWVPLLNGSSAMASSRVNISRELGFAKQMGDVWAEFIYADGVVGPDFGTHGNDPTEDGLNSTTLDNGHNGGQGNDPKSLNSHYLELGGENAGYVMRPLLDERLQ